MDDKELEHLQSQLPKFALRTPTQEILQKTEMERLKQLTSKIKDNKELRRKLRQSPAVIREAVYDLIVPYLSFKPDSFEVLSRKGRV